MPRDWRTREDPFEEDWAELRSAAGGGAGARGQDAVRGSGAAQAGRATSRGSCGRCSGGSSSGGRRRGRRRGSSSRRSTGRARRCRPTSRGRTSWGSRSGASRSRTCCATRCCRTRTGSGRRCCQSESMAALRRGVQAALFRLGRVPRTTRRTTRRRRRTTCATGKRGFNAEYAALVRHFGMTPRTIEVGEKEQNGDVEALQRRAEAAARAALLLRGSRDFETVAAYEGWVHDAVRGRRTDCGRRGVAEELAVMRPLRAARLPEFVEEDVRVTAWSTIRVQAQRLLGAVAADAARWCGSGSTTSGSRSTSAGAPQLTCERLPGRNGHRINYRHMIWSLVRKPGAFARYRYREELFPVAGLPPGLRRAPRRRTTAATARPGVPADPAPGGARRWRPTSSRRSSGCWRPGRCRRREAGARRWWRPSARRCPRWPPAAVDLAEYDALLAPVAEVVRMSGGAARQALAMQLRALKLPSFVAHHGGAGAAGRDGRAGPSTASCDDWPSSSSRSARAGASSGC